jgi:pyruvate dehydrogenase E2 component (dihydrolipoamide acetyltransferase)
MAEFRMPSLGADMDSGTLVQWLVAPGDDVERGDIVAVVETQKGAIDVEIFDSGTITQLVIEEGTEIPVGTVMAILNGTAHAPSTETLVVEPAPLVEDIPAKEAPIRPAAEPGRARISPLARRRASELGVELSAIRPARPSGTIGVADVEAAARQAAAPRVADDGRAAMRAAIAATMTRSNQDIPHYYLMTDIDLSRSLDWLEARNRDLPVSERILYAALLIKAVARAAIEIPELNGLYKDSDFEPAGNAHVGCAISLRGGGLVAPAIHNVESLTVTEVMAKLSDLITRARSGRLRSSEISDPTITVTSLGEQGVPAVFGVIFPPQVALVGFGKIEPRPRVTEAGIEARPMLTATLAADHRVSDGHRGGLFLAAVDQHLQDPEQL